MTVKGARSTSPPRSMPSSRTTWSHRLSHAVALQLLLHQEPADAILARADVLVSVLEKGVFTWCS